MENSVAEVLYHKKCEMLPTDSHFWHQKFRESMLKIAPFTYTQNLFDLQTIYKKKLPPYTGTCYFGYVQNIYNNPLCIL